MQNTELIKTIQKNFIAEQNVWFMNNTQVRISAE